MNLIDEANKVFLENFKAETWFERAIFFSWYCGIADCKYCYMSTQKAKKVARRSLDSILAEVIICKQFGWKLGFFSGGSKAYNLIDFKKIIKEVSNLYGEKIWINVGALNKKELKEYKPYIKGVVGAIEILDPKLHKEICPSKPIEPMVKMFKEADKLGLEKGMTIILGLGEKLEDFENLKEFIKENKISKIHFYGLNPQKGTIFENSKRIKKEYHAEWISKTRIEFPKIDIQAGIWIDKVEDVGLLLKAGANSISKFPAIRHFNSKEAKIIENEAKKSGRVFRGTLTDISRFKEVKIERNIKDKIERYLKVMGKLKN